MCLERNAYRYLVEILKKKKIGSPTKELKDNINMTVINMYCRYKWHMFVLRGIWKIILLAVWEIVFSY